METAYLDIVNSELRDIERLFQDVYKPATSATHLLRLLPLLGLSPIPSSYLDTPGILPTYSTSSLDEDNRAIAALSARYKQLKTVQDQLHIELTRLRIWNITKQPPSSESQPIPPFTTASVTAVDKSTMSRKRDAKESSCIVFKAALWCTLTLVVCWWIVSTELEKAARRTYPWPRR